MIRSLLIPAALAPIAACAILGHPQPDVPTLGVNSSGYNVERHKSRTVRVCGRLTWVEGRWAVQHVQRPREFFLHGLPAVFIVPCGETPPRLDRHGCLVGRIAREDGSLEEPRRLLTNDSPFTHYWLLHPQCRGRQTGLSPTASATPARRLWLNYHSYTYSSDTRPTPAGNIADEGDGFILPFAIRLRSLRAAAAQIDVRDAVRRQGRPTRLELRLNDQSWPAAGWRARSTDAAALLLRFVTLDLPPPQSGDLSAFYRHHTAAGRWPWMAERIRGIGRDVTIEVRVSIAGGWSRWSGGRPAAA